MNRKPEGEGSLRSGKRSSRKQASLEDPPALRSPAFEALLCRAIQDRLLVELRYGNDWSYRLFAPHAVYRSRTNTINVSGTQLENLGDSSDAGEPKIFEISKIGRVQITDRQFVPDDRFDRSIRRHKRGIICSV